MDPLFSGAIVLVLLFVLLSLGVWIAITMLAISIVGMMAFTDAPAGLVMATTIWSNASIWTLTALPLFIWMGEILFCTRLSEDLFRGLAPWMMRMPGQLLHVNVIGCGIFAAVSGSSAATCATIGRMTLPELKRRGYPEPISVGSLAGAGTLGILIPPSIVMIVYGITAQVSIGKLFIAGIVPGIMMMALFSGYIVLWSMANSRALPHNQERFTLFQRIAAGRHMIPVVLLILLIIGSIYGGFATATEAAVIGLWGSLILAWLSGGLNWQSFWESAMAAMRTSTMIAFILAGSSFLTVAIGFIGTPRVLAGFIVGQELSPYMLLIILTGFFILLGCVLDGISIVVLTSAILLPMVSAAGIDLLWFGIYIVLVVEMSLVTPPIGFNLFVLQGMTGKNIGFIAHSALPFFGLMVVAVVAITLFPAIVTFLPRQMLN